MSSPTEPAWPGQVLVKVLTEPAFDDRVHLLIDEHIETAIDAGLADLTLDLDTRVSEAIAAQDLITTAEADAKIATAISAQDLLTPAEVDAQIAVKNLASAASVNALSTRVDELEILTPADVDAQITAKDLATVAEVDAKVAAVPVMTTATVDARIDIKLDELPPPSAVNRQTATVTRTIAAGSDVEAPIALAPSYALIGLSTSVPARVRLYPTTAAASADASRPVTENPSTTSELVLEYVTTGSSSVAISPAVTGASLASPPSSTVVARIANLSSASASVTLTLTYLALEA